MKKLALLLAIVMCATLFAACGRTTSPTPTPTTATDNTPDETPDAVPDEIPDEVPGARVFTLGFDPHFPPYGYQDDKGEYVGFDVDLATEVCARLGWELVLQPIDWDAKLFEIESGSIDCIWNGFTITEPRLLEYEWTVPYVDNSQVFVVAAESGITDKAGLAGKIVIVQTDSSAESALLNEDNAELTASFAALDPVADYNTAFMTLVAGGADAVAMDIGVANYQLSQREGFVILEEALAAEQYGVGFKLGNIELRDTVQATLLEMADDGTVDEIAEKWGLTDSVVLGK